MKILTAIALTLVLLSVPAGADDPPVPAAPTDPVAPATPTDPPAPATPTTPRPDFSTIQKHLVVVKDGLESANQSPGFSISDQGHIVTYAGELRDSQSYLVETAGGQFSATRIKADETTGVWILQLSDAGHGLTGLPFASTALQAAAPLHAVNFNPSGSERFTSVPGSVTQLTTTEQGQMIRHNALFSVASAGTPLLNRCFQAVGVNLLEEEGRFFSRPVDPTQKGSALSLASASLDSLLTGLGLSLPAAGSECLSLEEEREQEREQARQAQEAERQREQEAAAQRVNEAEEEAQRKVEQTEQEKQAALQRQREEADRREAELQREKDEALRREQEAEEEAQRKVEQTEQEKQAALQRQREEADRREAALRREQEKTEQRQRRILLVGSVIGGLALLGVAWLMRRKQKRLQTTEQEKQHIEQEKQNISGALNRAQSELFQAEEQNRLRSTAPDVFIEGETPPIALKIPGAALVERAGAIVGRSPSASVFVINHEQISRQHFRLSLVSQQVMIEDLGSTNGTSVDGVALEPGQQRPVGEGSRLGLGDLELTLHIGG